MDKVKIIDIMGNEHIKWLGNIYTERNDTNDRFFVYSLNQEATIEIFETEYKRVDKLIIEFKKGI